MLWSKFCVCSASPPGFSLEEHKGIQSYALPSTIFLLQAAPSWTAPSLGQLQLPQEQSLPDHLTGFLFLSRELMSSHWFNPLWQRVGGGQNPAGLPQERGWPGLSSKLLKSPELQGPAVESWHAQLQTWHFSPKWCHWFWTFTKISLAPIMTQSLCHWD